MFILVASPLSIVTTACEPKNKISQDSNNIYNLSFQKPIFKNSSPVAWSKKSSFVQQHHINTNFFLLLAGEQQPESYFYKWQQEVGNKLKHIYHAIKDATSEPIFGDGIQLAKTMEKYSDYSSSSHYASNYDRILSSKASSLINPIGASWWKTDYYYHGQNWRVILQNLFKVFQKYNDYLVTQKYENYFSVFLKFINTFGYTSNLSDFHFFVKMMDLYKVLFGLLSPAAVARTVGRFVMGLIDKDKPGETVNE